MPRIAVRLSDEQAKHIEALADQADVDEADIIRGLIELDMKGPKATKDPVVEGLLKQLTEHLTEKHIAFMTPSNKRRPEKRERRIVGGVDERTPGRWRARSSRVDGNGKQRVLGTFDTKEEAEAAVRQDLRRS